MWCDEVVSVDVKNKIVPISGVWLMIFDVFFWNDWIVDNM